MLAYPGYTIGSIERELSWRQVDLLMKCWEKEQPPFLTNRTIERVLEKAHGISVTKRQSSSDDLVQKLEGLGWL